MRQPPTGHTRDESRAIVRKARKLVGMVQGTMALEGQGLPRKTLREFTRIAVRHLTSSR